MEYNNTELEIKQGSLKALLYDQLKRIQGVIEKIMLDRKKIGDKKYYELIELWSERETQVRHEISEL